MEPLPRLPRVSTAGRLSISGTRVELIEEARLREQLRALGVGNGLVAKVRGGTV